MATVGDAVTLLRTRFRDPDGTYLTTTVAVDYINTAIREWARRTQSVARAKGLKIISDKQRYPYPRGLIRPLWWWHLQQIRPRLVARTKYASPYFQPWAFAHSGMPLFCYADQGDFNIVPIPNYKEPAATLMLPVAATDLEIKATPITSGFPHKGRILIVDGSLLPSLDSEDSSGDAQITKEGGAIYPTGSLAGKVEEIWYNHYSQDTASDTMTFSRCIRGAGETTALAWTTRAVVVRLSVEVHYIVIPKSATTTLTDTLDIADNDLDGVISHALALAFLATKQMNDAAFWSKQFEDFVAMRVKENVAKRGDMQLRLNYETPEQYMEAW